MLPNTQLYTSILHLGPSVCTATAAAEARWRAGAGVAAATGAVGYGVSQQASCALRLTLEQLRGFCRSGSLDLPGFTADNGFETTENLALQLAGVPVATDWFIGTWGNSNVTERGDWVLVDAPASGAQFELLLYAQRCLQMHILDARWCCIDSAMSHVPVGCVSHASVAALDRPSKL